MGNDERMIKKLKIIENLIKYSSSNKNINMVKNGFCEYFLKKDNFLNLYTFLKVLKAQNKTIINLAKDNIFFIKETIRVFININDLIKNNKVINYNQDNKIKIKTEFVLNEIKQFFNDLFQDEKNKYCLLQCEIDNYPKIFNLLIELALYYNNKFEGNINKNYLKNKYNEFKNMISFIFTKIKEIKEMIDGKKQYFIGRFKKRIKIYDFSQTLNKLYQNDVNIFCDFLEIVLLYFNTLTKENITRIITSIMRVNITNFFNNFSRIKEALSKSKDFDLEKEMDKIQIIEFILNNSDYNTYTKVNLIKNSTMYKNFKKAILLLSKIKNQKASLFVFNKIEIFINCRNNSEKFIEFIKNAINNNFIFDYLLNSLSKNEKEYIFKNNKDNQKIIISSLFKYSTMNGYYIIKELLIHLSKYIPKNDFQSIIYSPLNEPNVSPDQYNLEEIFIEDKKDYLLSYALSVKFVKNFESIAVILSHCQYPQGLMKLFEYLNIGVNLNFSNFKSFSFFSGIENKEKIKELEINFYNLIILEESITSNYNILEKYSDIEKFMFNNIIKIFIMDITPRELMLLTDINLPESKFKNIKNDENKLFILLSLFEIKGLPIMPIKKYFPSFYYKIENFFNKFKTLIKINPICLKQNADIKLYEKLKLLIKEKDFRYIIENFPLFNNLLAIFLQEKKENYIQKSYDQKMTSIHKLILDLIMDNNIVPFYDNQTSEEFFSSIYSLNEKKEVDMKSYRILINSLVDFHQTSYIIIQNNEEERKKYKWKERSVILQVYSSYLKAITNICRYVILICDENKGFYNVNYFVENISEENENRLNSLKNSINLDKIIMNIFRQIENNKNNNDDFFNIIKNWINDYLKNNSLIKRLSNEKIVNILSYFKYLNIVCSILLKFIIQLNNLNDIRTDLINLNYLKSTSINIKLFPSKDKTISQKGIRESFYQLGTKILDFVRNEIVLSEKQDCQLVNQIKSNISIYYYFNEEREEFLESSTDINLIKFIKEKTNSIFSFINVVKADDDIFLDENISYEKLNSIISESCLTLYNGFDTVQNDGTFKIFQLYMKKNNDYICKYLERTAFDLYQPNYNDCRTLMIDNIKQIIFNYLYPSILFNQLLFVFCLNNAFQNYVDFSEIISSIKETKFHSNENLNVSFQIKAINYLIDNRSNLYLFLLELFDKILKKSHKKKKFEIKECFRIKVEKENKSKFELIKRGENNSEISDIHSIISNMSLNSKKKKFKLKTIDFVNSKNKLFFSIVSINNMKRKVPTINRGMHIPRSNDYPGTTIGNIYKEVFNKSLIIHNKPLFYQEMTKNNPVKREKKSNIKLINVFEYIFTIKSVDNKKIIHISQNDISEILRNYSDEEAFKELLNKNGFIEKKWKLQFDLDKIEISYKFP